MLSKDLGLSVPKLPRRALGLSVVAVSVAVAANVQAAPKLLWGDTHLHTAYSFDAFLNNNHSATPDVAYRFARGEPVIHPYHRARMQIDKPLDFVVIADHAEYFGVAREIYFNGVQLGDDAGPIDRLIGWITERRIRGLIDGDGGFQAFLDLLPDAGDPHKAAENFWEGGNAPSIINAEALVRKTWDTSITLADSYYEPGEFSTFVGWEWSSMPGGGNLHRVVMSTANAEQASNFLPYGSDQSPYPEDLWAWLAKTEAETGAEFLSIPHNSNISKGFMFADTTLRGEAFTPDYASNRLRWEPVVEVTQIKGDSETLPLFSPEDEFAEYETYGWYIQDEYQEFAPTEADFVRPALRKGLALEQKLGVNPYAVGMIGSTDSHSGLATVDDEGFGGKLARDSTPETKSRDDGRTDFASGWSMAASGLAAVWAEDNTREAIMAAMKRREVYATTGPRIQLQLFGAWDFDGLDLDDSDVAAKARAAGVPMGGDLPASEHAEQAPQFVVLAARDVDGLNLDRIQIVKGWLKADGSTAEQVYDVAWSGHRHRLANGKLPAVGDTVDRRTGNTGNTIGAAQLSAYWQDPNFDPQQRAFYYVRVLQIPSARHLYKDALALGLEAPMEGASIIQERAYSSPIWYHPAR